MANGGLRSVREALLLADDTNVIDSAGQKSYFLTGNSTNLTLTTGTIPSAERNYDSAKPGRLYLGR